LLDPALLDFGRRGKASVAVEGLELLAPHWQRYPPASKAALSKARYHRHVALVRSRRYPKNQLLAEDYRSLAEICRAACPRLGAGAVAHAIAAEGAVALRVLRANATEVNMACTILDGCMRDVKALAGDPNITLNAERLQEAAKKPPGKRRAPPKPSPEEALAKAQQKADGRARQAQVALEKARAKAQAAEETAAKAKREAEQLAAGERPAEAAEGEQVD
jgi:hypothetical protein